LWLLAYPDTFRYVGRKHVREETCRSCAQRSVTRDEDQAPATRSKGKADYRFMSTESAEPTFVAARSEGEIQQGTRVELPWRAGDAFYLLALLCLVIAMAVRFTPNLTGEIPGQWWDPLLNMWTLSWDTTTLLHNPTHLWQAQLLYPNNLSLSYSENLLGEAVFFGPVFLLTHNPVFAYNVTFYLTFLLCGINMYIMARHYTGMRFAAFVAALIFTFAPYRLSQIDHIHVIAGEWMPLALLCIDLALRRGSWRYWILFGLFYLLQLLNSIYYGIFLAYILLAFVLISSSIPFVKRLRRDKAAYLAYLVRRAIRPAAVFAALLVIIFVLMAPYLQSLKSGFSRSLGQSTGYAAYIRDFFFASPFNWLYGISYYNGAVLPFDSEHYLFLGLTTVALTVLGVVCVVRRKDARLRPYLWTGLLALLFAFGPVLQYSTSTDSPYIADASKYLPFLIPHVKSLYVPMPWMLAFYALPGFAGLRVPSRLIGVLLIILALLAAYAVAWLQKSVGRTQARGAGASVKGRHGLARAVPLALRGLLLLLPLAILLESLPAYLPVTSVPTGKQIPQVYQWLAHNGGQQPLVELPMAYFNDEFSLKAEAWYDYYAIYHAHPIADGWSGYRPPLTEHMASLLENFPSVQSLGLIKRYHIYYIVLHLQLYPPLTAASILARAGANPALRRVAQFGTDSVWQVMYP
jgi:hypothetical protein